MVRVVVFVRLADLALAGAVVVGHDPDVADRRFGEAEIETSSNCPGSRRVVVTVCAQQRAALLRVAVVERDGDGGRDEQFAAVADAGGQRGVLVAAGRAEIGCRQVGGAQRVQPGWAFSR